MQIVTNTKEGQWDLPRGCPGCLSKLVVNASDIQYEVDYRGFASFFYVCPVCNRKNWVDGWDIPNHIREPIKKAWKDAQPKPRKSWWTRLWDAILP